MGLSKVMVKDHELLVTGTLKVSVATWKNISLKYFPLKLPYVMTLTCPFGQKLVGVTRAEQLEAANVGCATANKVRILDVRNIIPAVRVPRDKLNSLLTEKQSFIA